jgi:galactokinase
MDQFIACSGESGHALLIDCRSLDSQLLPLSEEVKIVVCNTKVKHNLAAGEYNQRRAGCEAAVRSLKKWLPQIRALRDVSLEQLEKHKAELAPETYRLARHVVSENARVEEAAGVLQRGELRDFGRLMYESHRSLRDDYQVSCKELDVMVDLASQQPGVIGARMTGGGFGGCTVNLVEKDHVAQFVKNVAEDYLSATGITPEIYVCEAADGASKFLSC